MNNVKLMATMTGEYFQPVRIYYKVKSMAALQKKFSAISCMNFDSGNNRWVWLFDDECKMLQFEKNYDSIPMDLRPIVLGSFFSSSSQEMRLDVGSIERAIQGILFFDKHVGKKIATAYYCAFYNKIFTDRDKRPGPDFDSVFASIDIRTVEAQRQAKFENAVAQFKTGNPDELIGECEFELIEALPISSYKGGVKQFEIALKMRRIVAVKRYQGDKDFTLSKLISQMFENPRSSTR